MQSYTHICTPMFLTALFKITRSWKKARCPSTDELTKKNVVDTHSGIPFTLKKEGFLTHAMTWMNLEDFMLSEIKPSTKGKILYDSTHIRYVEYSNS